MLRHAVLLAFASLALLACDKKTRTRNSGGSSTLVAEGDVAPTVPVYHFSSVEQTLADARKAAAAEKWGEAGAAADALLKEIPTNAEAQNISQQAKLEAPNQTHYLAFSKAAAASDAVAMAKAWRSISDASLYKEKGRPTFDKVKTAYVASQETDARAMARLGRCDDARRLARITGEYFADAKASLDDIVTACRPVRDDKPDKTEVAAVDKKPDDRSDTPSALAAAQKPAPEPMPTASTASRTPDAPKMVASIEPPPVDTTLRIVPAAAPVTRVAGTMKKIPPTELETHRISGDRTPSLPANIVTIAKRDNVKSILLGIEVCVGTEGKVESAKLLKGSEYDEGNAGVLAAIRKWRFRPYLSEGVPTPVCSGIVLNYAIASSTCGGRNTGVGCKD